MCHLYCEMKTNLTEMCIRDRASIQRRAPGRHDVQIEILFCGICHTDVHIARNEWGATIYPCVPGHEIVGRVTQVGAAVKKFQPGDLAAVGCCLLYTS